jgi:hypothetical protein
VVLLEYHGNIIGFFHGRYDVLGGARGALHNFGYGSPTTMVVEDTY